MKAVACFRLADCADCSGTLSGNWAQCRHTVSQEQPFTLVLFSEKHCCASFKSQSSRSERCDYEPSSEGAVGSSGGVAPRRLRAQQGASGDRLDSGWSEPSRGGTHNLPVSGSDPPPDHRAGCSTAGHHLHLHART